MSNENADVAAKIRSNFEVLIKEVAQRLSSELTEGGEGTSYVIKVHLQGGRSQMVFVNLDDDTVRFSTRCSSFRSDFNNPNLFKILLAKNYRLKYGYFALNPEGGVEIVATQLLATCDAAELTVSIVNLATVGDFMERELAQDGTDIY